MSSPLDLSTLDSFVLSRVLVCFSAHDIVKSSYVCKQWHHIAQDPSLWYHLYSRDFGNYSSTAPLVASNADWKRKYAFATSIYILRNFTLGDNNSKAQKMCWIGMLLTKQDKSYLSALSRYPLYNQSIYCWNVYIKRMGQIVCMSVVDMKPQPLYENPVDLIDGICFTYSVHDMESFDTLKANIAHKKEIMKGRCIVLIALTLCASPRVVPTADGKELASQTKADFHEVDLRSYAGLDESFIYLLENINKTRSLRHYSCVEETEIIRHKKKKRSRNGKCIIS